MTHGSFELEDPAQKIFEDLEKDDQGEPPQQDTASDTFGERANTDVGSTACSDFVSYRQDHSERYWSSLSWLQGFISGATRRGSDTLGDSRLGGDHDLDSMALWIENYCLGNPPDSLTQAAEAFIENSSKR